MSDQMRGAPVFIVEYRLKANPMIVNARPHPWRPLTRPMPKGDAEAQAQDLRAFAAVEGLAYMYRVRAENAL